MPGFATSIPNQLAANVRPLIRRLWIVTALVAICVSDALAADTPATTALSWIPAETVTIVSLRPADLVAQKNFEGLPKRFLEEYVRDLGLTPEKIEQLNLLSLKPGGNADQSRTPTMIIRLKTAEMVVTRMSEIAPVEIREYKGTKYEFAAPAGWVQIDPKTFLFATEENLKRLIAAGPTSELPLLKTNHWQSIGGQPFAAVIDIHAISRTTPLEEPPPPLREIMAPLWTDASALYLAGRWDESLKLLVLVQGREGSTLQKTKETLTAAQTMANNMLAGFRAQVPAGADGATSPYGALLDMSDGLLKSVKVYDEPEKNTLKIIASAPIDAKRVATKELSGSQD